MFLLLSLLFGAAMVLTLVFWLLFFLIVKLRIADKNLHVPESSRFGFLLTRWPHEEMRAYLASLNAQEKRRPVNQFLRYAWHITAGLFTAYAAALIIVMVTGSEL